MDIPYPNDSYCKPQITDYNVVNDKELEQLYDFTHYHEQIGDTLNNNDDHVVNEESIENQSDFDIFDSNFVASTLAMSKSLQDIQMTQNIPMRFDDARVAPMRPHSLAFTDEHISVSILLM